MDIDFTQSKQIIHDKITKALTRGGSINIARNTLESSGFKCYIIKDDPCAIDKKLASCGSKPSDKIILVCFRLPLKSSEPLLRWQVSAVLSDERIIEEVFIQSTKVITNNI